MPTFKLPLSGDITRAISPWTAFMSPLGSQIGWFNVTIGQSSEPAVEGDVLSDVASYGKQLGRIGDALVVLLAHFHPAAPLTKEETDAIDDLKHMLERIADVKDKHKRKALRPSAHVPSPASPPYPPPQAGEGREGAAAAPLPSIPAPTEPVPTPAVPPTAPASSRRAARKSSRGHSPNGREQRR
jgi:hypothetical protein